MGRVLVQARNIPVCAYQGAALRISPRFRKVKAFVFKTEKNMKRIVFFALLGVSLPISSGARSSDVCFSPQEVRTMFEKRDLVSRAAAKCLKNYWETHQKFFQENGYSKYFGNRNKALNTEDKQIGRAHV